MLCSFSNTKSSYIGSMASLDLTCNEVLSEDDIGGDVLSATTVIDKPCGVSEYNFNLGPPINEEMTELLGTSEYLPLSSTGDSFSGIQSPSYTGDINDSDSLLILGPMIDFDTLMQEDTETLIPPADFDGLDDHLLKKEKKAEPRKTEWRGSKILFDVPRGDYALAALEGCDLPKPGTYVSPEQHARAIAAIQSTRSAVSAKLQKRRRSLWYSQMREIRKEYKDKFKLITDQIAQRHHDYTQITKRSMETERKFYTVSAELKAMTQLARTQEAAIRLMHERKGHYDAKVHEVQYLRDQLDQALGIIDKLKSSRDVNKDDYVCPPAPATPKLPK